MTTGSVENRLSGWIEDATWLKTEVDALRRVTEVLPFDDTAPEHGSLLQKIALLNHLQENHLLPELRRFPSVDSGETFTDIDVTIANFQWNPEKEGDDVQSLLERLSENRSEAVRRAGTLPLEEPRLHALIDRLFLQLAREREILKEMGELARLFMIEIANRRELDRKLEGRGRQQNPPDNGKNRVE